MNTVWLVYTRDPDEDRECLEFVCSSFSIAEREAALARDEGMTARISLRIVMDE